MCRKFLNRYGVWITWDGVACDPTSTATIELPDGHSVYLRRESKRSQYRCTNGFFSVGSDKYFLIKDGVEKEMASFAEVMNSLGLVSRDTNE